jgi:hypothetical protein
MKLKGYIQGLKENSFTIPIYGDGISYFFHYLDDSFNIINFYDALLPETAFNKLYLSKNFEVGNQGAIVFIGSENYIAYNQADKVIDEIINYLTDTTLDPTFVNIKREVIELKQILIKSEVNIVLEESSGEIKTLKIKDNVKIDDITSINDANLVMYSLEEYIEAEEFIITKKDFHHFKENIIKKYLEKSVFNKNLYDTHKEVLFTLLRNYLDDNKSVFEELIFDSTIGNGFSTYLSRKNDVMITPFEFTISEILTIKSDERRKKLKEFNYKFHNNLSKIEEYEKEPAYKRAGIDLTETQNTNTKYSQIIISLETKDVYKEKNIEQVRKINHLDFSS